MIGCSQRLEGHSTRDRTAFPVLFGSTAKPDSSSLLFLSWQVVLFVEADIVGCENYVVVA